MCHCPMMSTSIIQQGTPTKNNISIRVWFNRLNLQNRRIFFQQVIANRDVAHELLIVFLLMLYKTVYYEETKTNNMLFVSLYKVD